MGKLYTWIKNIISSIILYCRRKYKKRALFVLVFIKVLIFQTLHSKEFSDLGIGGRVWDEVLNSFRITNILMISKLLYELSRLKCRENSLSMSGNLPYRVMISYYEIQIHIILPFCSPTHSICLHGSKSQKWGNFDDLLYILYRVDIEWIVKKGDFYIVDNPRILPFFMDMKYLPTSFACIENGLCGISLEIFPAKEIEIDTFTMSEMKCYRGTADHIKTSFARLGKKSEKVYLLRREYFEMHIISQDNGTSKRGFWVRYSGHDDFLKVSQNKMQMHAFTSGS